MENKEQQATNPNEFNKKAFLESYVQYKLTEEAEIDFRGFTKNGKDVDKDILEKRISVLIHTATSIKNLPPHNKNRYQFAGFVILTNEDEKTIDVVYWIRNKQKVSKATTNQLKLKYQAIGLDDTGFAILDESV